MKTYLPKADLIAALHISSTTLERLITAGKLPSPIKFGAGKSATARFDVEAVEAALAALAEKYSR